MRTVRRLYFYLVTIISLEVIVWGVITLARTMVDNLPGSGAVNLLAGGLSLVLVGLPIFLLHWAAAQRDAQRESEERITRLRALFLYSTRFALLAPVVFSSLAVINRSLLSLMNLAVNRALVGAGQTLADNLLAIAVNLVAWAYFERVLKSDWQLSQPEEDILASLRRLYRYAWLLYGLGLLTGGLYQVVSYIFFTPSTGMGLEKADWMVNGLAMLLVGAPLWMWTSRVIDRSLEEKEECDSLLRLGVLYALSVIGAVVTLMAGMSIVAGALRWLLGEARTVSEFLNDHYNAISAVVSFGVIWGYYSVQLQKQIQREPDNLRRAGLNRLYAFLLSLLGIGTLFGGMWQLLSALVDMLLGTQGWGAGLRTPLSWGIAAIGVGLPVWLRTWPGMQTEAARMDDFGDHARQSVVRKGYLYLLLFALVIGAMVSAGMIFFLLLSQVLGNPTEQFALELGQRAQTFVLVMVWLGYHFTALRGDGQRAQRALGEKHASYPILIIQSTDFDFVDHLLTTIHQHTPRIPVAVCRLGEDALKAEWLNAKLVILSADVAVNPPEALRLWLSEFEGQRLVIPRADPRWIWMGSQQRSALLLARETAQVVRQLAEKQPVKTTAQASTWIVVGYILAGLFALQLLLVLFSLLMSLAN